MNKTQFLQFHDRFTAEMRAISERKNSDYAGHSQSAFANFELIEKIGFLTTEQGFITRMSDKLSRLMTFVKNNELHVKDESVKDTLQDLANYCILFAGYLEYQKEQDALPFGGKIELAKDYELSEAKRREKDLSDLGISPDKSPEFDDELKGIDPDEFISIG